MGNISAWILHMANQSVGRWLGYNFTDLAEVGVPLIILGGLIMGWIYLRPRRPRY